MAAFRGGYGTINGKTVTAVWNDMCNRRIFFAYVLSVV
jgi:hypothetical protein